MFLWAMQSQLPSNLLLRELGVTHWLSFLVVSWGAVELAMGFVPTWEFLGLCRVLLGTFEVREFYLCLELISIILMSSKNRPDFSQLWSIS
jgi:hypothetical protein